jgi:prevent-host-death family protein
MGNVTIRELRNNGGEVVDRAAKGEPITITRAGKPVASLGPVASPALSADVLLSRWRRLPVVDAAALRRDVDRILDAGL